MDLWRRYSDYSACAEFAGRFRAAFPSAPAVSRKALVSTEETDLKASMTTLRKHLRRFCYLALSAVLALPWIYQAQALAQTAADSSKMVKAYSVAPAAAAATLRQLNQRYPESSGVRITYDSRTSQVLVVAPPELQQQVADFLQPRGTGESPNQNVGPTFGAKAANESSPGAAARGPKVVPLKHMTGREFEATLSNSLGRVLPVTEEHGGEWARYTLDTRGGSVAIVVDRRANQVALEGPVRLADAWARVIESLDARPQHSPDDTRVIPLTTAAHF